MVYDKLSHLDEAGRARMVDIGPKAETRRRAVAEAMLRMPPDVVKAVQDGNTPKGNVFEVARLAGIMAAKRTDELIPLCHSLLLDHVDVSFTWDEQTIRITASAAARGTTGVEMEALSAVSVAALTLYDMLKALSHEMTIEQVRLLEKTGGKSGAYRVRENPEGA